jgi:hypothetical protein
VHWLDAIAAICTSSAECLNIPSIGMNWHLCIALGTYHSLEGQVNGVVGLVTSTMLLWYNWKSAVFSVKYFSIDLAEDS